MRKQHYIAVVLLITALLAFTGCGSNHKPSPSPTPTPVATPTPVPVPQASIAHIGSRPGQPSNFLFSLVAHAASSFETTASAAVPAPLGQSFEGSCQFGNNPDDPNSTNAGAHSEFGNTGFVALNVANFSTLCGGTGIVGFHPHSLPAIGAADGITPKGSPIFVSGTITALVASAFTQNGKQIFCRDILDVQNVIDGVVTLPYLRLSDNTIMLGSGANQLLPSCQLPLDIGDDIVSLTVDWSKQ